MDYDHCVACGGVSNQFYHREINRDSFFRELDHYILSDGADESFVNFFKEYTPTFYQMFSNIFC
jgi:hypothetical protein